MTETRNRQAEAAQAIQAVDAPTTELRSPNGDRLFDPERSVLLGAYCSTCGKVFFPQRAVCPSCLEVGAMLERPLSRRGVVYASTVVRVPSSLGHQPPYAYGYVDLPEDKLRVMSRFTGSQPELFIPGTAVEITFETVPNEQFGAMLAWAFRLEQSK